MSVDIILLHMSASFTREVSSLEYRQYIRKKNFFMKIRKFWKNSKSIRSLITGPGKLSFLSLSLFLAYLTAKKFFLYIH